MSTNTKLSRVADNIRILSAAMVERAKSGHPGGAMGGADFMTVLYTEFLRYDPDRMDYPSATVFFSIRVTWRRCSIRCWRWPVISRQTI